MRLLPSLLRALAGLPLLLSLYARAEVAPGCEVLIENKPSIIFQYLDQAGAGDACAQFNLGYLYYTRQQYPVAERWYTKAAEQGISRAAFEIAMLYRDKLLPGGQEQTLRWLQQAAEQGLALAQTELGYLYLQDRQDARGLFTAMGWLEKAAEQGHPQAQYLLGEMYWSDARSSADADMALGEDEFHLLERYDSNDAKALYWLCQAAQNDDEFAQFSLSEAYSRGRGMPVDQLQSRLWLEKAATNGKEEAIAILASDNGSWYDKAELWIKRQAGDGLARCPQIALQRPQ